jgi:hypothetical protein
VVLGEKCQKLRTGKCWRGPLCFIFLSSIFLSQKRPSSIVASPYQFYKRLQCFELYSREYCSKLIITELE